MNYNNLHRAWIEKFCIKKEYLPDEVIINSVTVFSKQLKFLK